MLRICCFLDRDLWHQPDCTGMNKCGYVTKRETVVHPRRWGFTETSLKDLRRLRMKIYEYSCTVELSAQVESFFSQNVLNPTLMNRGFAALLSHNHDFFTYPIRLPKLTLLDLSDFEQRWGELLSLLQAGDVVQIFNSSSILSRMIATVEQGCWSHSAIYTGEGTVLEAITSGVSERPLTMYKNRVIHLGVYRNLNLSNSKRQQASSGIVHR